MKYNQEIVDRAVRLSAYKPLVNNHITHKAAVYMEKNYGQHHCKNADDEDFVAMYAYACGVVTDKFLRETMNKP